jgi:hypothetical protein
MSHWFKPVSTFGLLLVTTFIRSSHMLVVSAHPLLLSAFVLADSAWPRGSAYRLSGGYVVPRASHRAVAGSACPGRERLMEQPVSSGHTFSRETETQATFRSHVDIQSDAHRAIVFHAGLRGGNCRVWPCPHHAALAAMPTRVVSSTAGQPMPHGKS